MIAPTEGNDAMMGILRNKVIWGGVLMLAGFAVLRWLMEPADLLVLLNGLLAGAMVALGVAYYPLLWAALRNDGPYERGRQYGLGSFLTSAAICIGLITSIYVRTLDLYSLEFTSVALSRWLAFWGAVLKVTSKDFGAGLLHGMSRKVMWGSIIVGCAVAFTVILMQGGV